MKKYYLMFFCLCFLTALQAQEIAVKGKVTDETGQALPGVNILEKGTNNGTLSDSDGNYSINVKEDAYLIFSFVGFESFEVLATQTPPSIALAESLNELGEVVVIGYGEVKKEDLTGAVVAVGAKDFNKGVLSSPQDLLVGKLAGVTVTTNSGAPGSGSTIRIRGGSSLSAVNDPLIVIDGFPVDNGKAIGGSSNPLASINPNDIESFTVLKDASATAIYGSRASNGVIIIVTKKGSEGKPKIDYSFNLSLSTPAKYFDVLSGDEFRDLADQLVADDVVDGLDASALNKLGTENTDWQREIYRDAISHDHNISLSGKVSELPFRISYGYTNQQGILRTTHSNRHSLNINLTPSLLHDNLKIVVSAKGSRTDNAFGNTGAIGAAVAYDPTQPVRNDNTRWGGYYTWVVDPLDPNSDQIDLGPSNPVALLNLTDNSAIVNRLIGNVQASYKFPFVSGLTATVNVGIDHTESEGKNNTSILAPWAPTPGSGQLIDYTGKNNSKLFDFYMNYLKTMESHQLEVTGGYSYQSFRNDGSNFSRDSFGTEFYDYEDVIVDEDTTKAARQYVPEVNYLLSFFGRAQYSFKDKYFLTVTYRTDGSSRFSEENRWGSFPALALAWNLAKEPFLAGNKTVSNLKLRLGYGITGQQYLSTADNPAYKSYPYLPIYIESTPTAQYQFGNQFYNTYRPNPYDGLIKWEETTTYNVGVDFGLITNIITGSVELYQRDTRDLINFIPVAAGSTFSNFLTTNVGSLENRGIELTLNASLYDKEDFAWRVGFNLTKNVNEITKLTRVDDPNYLGVAVGDIEGGVGNKVQIHSIGYPASSYFVFEQVYNSNGKPIEGLFVDRSGEGGAVASNEKNKYKLNNPIAKTLMGINSSVRYKQFDAYVSGRLSLGNYVYNNRAANSTYSSVYVNTGFFNNVARYVFDSDFVNPQYWSDFYVENASFFKMDNISIGYSPARILGGRANARFSFTVQNAFVVTDYKGIDPEVNDGTNPGIDKNIYPRPRTFVFNVKLTY